MPGFDDRRCVLGATFAQDSLAVLKAMLSVENVLKTGCKVKKHPQCCVLCVKNNDCSRIPVHVNCLIGSTRVAGPSTVVPAEEPFRLASDPSGGGVGHGGDGCLAPTSTLAEAERDFGRDDLRAVMVREYVGDVVTIRTASGQELTGTPNHPVATRGGWVGLAELQVGDHVLRSTRPEWVSNLVDPDVDDVPPTIEQVVQTFPVTFGPMPTSPQDFHADGAGSNVHVVLTDGFLVDDIESLCAEHRTQFELSGGHSSVDSPFAGSGGEFQFGGTSLPSANGIMGGRGEPGPLLRGRLGHSGVHGFTAAADPDLSGLNESTPDASPADAEGFCERLLAFSAGVTTDEIVYVDRGFLDGHVYNLETIGGWYVANSILTHNCRCTPEPYLTSLE